MDLDNAENYDIYVETTDPDGNDYDLVSYDVAMLSMALQGGPPTGLIVDKSVENKWGVGAEVVITSHTNDWEDAQKRTIAEVVSMPGDNAHVALILNESFKKPIVENGNPNPQTAVEVALLSRMIQFIGDDDNDQGGLHGGHFWVKHTPSVVQMIEGVEIINFGQQGNLGRYPLHFHMCKDVSGSVVSRNTVRDSNQRGMVVHGTDSLLLKENILYYTSKSQAVGVEVVF